MKVTVSHCPRCKKKIALKTISNAEAIALREEELRKREIHPDEKAEMRAIIKRHSRPLRLDRKGFPLPEERMVA